VYVTDLIFSMKKKAKIAKKEMRNKIKKEDGTEKYNY
jgi:hypothetical protein